MERVFGTRWVLLGIVGILFNLSCNREDKTQPSDNIFLLSYSDCIDFKGDHYEVKDNLDLGGKVWVLPDQLHLDFCFHNVSNGQLELGNGCIIENGFFINNNELTYRRIHYDGRVLDYCVALSVLDKSTVRILNCTFYTDQDRLKIAPTENFGVMVYGTSDCGCKDIIVDSCQFNGSSCNFFSNVSYSTISRCEFMGPRHMLSVETIYNLEHNGVYCNPSGITINNCSFITKGSNPSEPPIWFSGVDSLLFNNNYCESDRHIIQLYCGDFNMGIRNAHINNSFFSIEAGSEDINSVSAITCWGKSYKWPEEGNLSNTIAFNNCSFGFKNGGLDNSLSVCRALNVRFIENVAVSSCIFDGFIEAIGLYDSFRGSYYKTTSANVRNNIFMGVSAPVTYELRDNNPNFKYLVFKNNTIHGRAENECFISSLSSYNNCDVSDNDLVD